MYSSLTVCMYNLDMIEVPISIIFLGYRHKKSARVHVYCVDNRLTSIRFFSNCFVLLLNITTASCLLSLILECSVWVCILYEIYSAQ
jgi:hypothetical protein